MKRLHGSLSRQHRVGALLLTLFGGVAILPLLFWIVGTEPHSESKLLDRVPTSERGVYLALSDAVVPLFAWNLQMLRLPENAAVQDAAVVQSLIVVQKQFGSAGEYQLLKLDDWTRVRWQTVQHDDRQLTLVPTAFVPGDYMLVVQTDGLFGGKTYHYFQLR